jgi:hypothetical protein
MDRTRLPSAGSSEERSEFQDLQRRLPTLFREVFRDRLAPRTVVVCPGLSLDPEVLAKVCGARHYEERMLSMLMLLRFPNTRVVFLTSEPVAPVIIDYYLSLLSGVPASHARERLLLFSAHDASPVSLTRKLLDRPRLLARIRAAIGDAECAHLSVFNASAEEVSLAVALGIPMYACDPALEYWGGKSGSRRAFEEAGIAHPDGAGDLLDLDQAAAALAALVTRRPGLRRAVLKVNQGFSGEGNAVVDLSGFDSPPSERVLRERLPGLIVPEAPGLSVPQYEALFQRHGGIVEAWIEGDVKRTPSVQLRVNPLGEIELISTHEQIMGGRSGQVFQGSAFPAHADYAVELHAMGIRVAEVLRGKGVLGRFSIDFVSVERHGGWEHQAIEINLRKGGTTLPHQMLQFLTDGRYCAGTARFLTPMGQPRCYYATDNLVSPDYRRLVPQDLIDLLVEHRLQFDETLQQGLVFNLIGALSEFGKLGLVCIADTPDAARAQFEAAKALLDREARAAD